LDIKPIHTKYTTIDSNETAHAKHRATNGEKNTKIF
jgi:hypothetical protein